MEERSRRSFLKRSAALLAGLGATEVVPAHAAEPGDDLDPALLHAVAAVVLPTELGDGGIREVVAGFREWLDGFEPAAELEHGYGTHEVEYAPPDPAPRWNAQLRAMDLEARKRFDRSLVELPVETRRDLVRRQLARAGTDRFPSPGDADHVATGLLAFYYEQPDATDLCYGVAIRKLTCRGHASVDQVPPALQRER